MILDPGEDICQIHLRILAVQFDRFDDGQDVGDALTALVRAGEEPDAMTIPPCDVVR